MGLGLDYFAVAGYCAAPVEACARVLDGYRVLWELYYWVADGYSPVAADVTDGGCSHKVLWCGYFTDPVSREIYLILFCDIV